MFQTFGKVDCRSLQIGLCWLSVIALPHAIARSDACHSNTLSCWLAVLAEGNVLSECWQSTSQLCFFLVGVVTSVLSHQAIVATFRTSKWRTPAWGDDLSECTQEELFILLWRNIYWLRPTSVCMPRPALLCKSGCFQYFRIWFGSFLLLLLILHKVTSQFNV